MSGKLYHFSGLARRCLSGALLGAFLAGACLAQTSVPQGEVPLEPVVADEILDLAIEHCRRGENVQAQAIFKAIKEQLDPPRSHLEIIAQHEAVGCQMPAYSPSVRWNVQAGGGYDTNVNQGILSRYMVFGSGLNEIELELGDAYKPVPSAFAVAGLDASFRFGDFAVGQAAIQHRSNASLPALNLTTLTAGVVRPFVILDRPGRLQVDVGEAWLRGSRYQQIGAAGVQWLLTESGQPWLANVATLRNRYPSQPDQDSQLTEAGIWREQMLAPTFGVFGGIAALYDNALRNRPGGDRAGYRVQLGLSTGWGEWLIQPRINMLRWRSSEVYSPGLVDVVRRHQLTQIGLQLTRPIAQGQQVVVEWRINDARDSVSLFSYRGQSLGVYWRAQR
mgnify:CR=1 FL=1|jgi:hypothetical protein